MKILRLRRNISFLYDLRGCELQVHPIESQKQRDRRMGVPNLRRDAPFRSFSRSLWSSQVLWSSQLSPPGVNEKVATSDRTPSVMTARLEYLWEIMDHGKKKGSRANGCNKMLSKICLLNIY